MYKYIILLFVFTNHLFCQVGAIESIADLEAKIATKKFKTIKKFNQGGLVKNNLQPIVQNKKESLDNNILASPNTDSEIQVLPPISSPQTSEIKDNAPVMAQPSQAPLPSTKELADTNSPVHFIDLIST